MEAVVRARHAAVRLIPWFASLATTVLLVLTGAGLMLVIRRLSGSLTRPLEVVPLLVVAVVLAFAAGSFRAAWRAASGRPLSLPFFLAPLPMILLWAAGVCPTTGTFRGLFLAILAASEVGSWWHLYWLDRRTPLPAARPTVFTPSTMLAAPGESEFAIMHVVSEDDVLADDDEAVCQRMTRRVEEGTDILEGWVRVPFQVGQRHATAHVAICPAMSASPECEAEPADGPAFTVKTGQVLPIGVRFEIKLDEPAEEPTSVVVAFTLSAPVNGS